MNEQELLDEDADYAAWSHQRDLEAREFMDEESWYEMQATIVTQYEVQRDELKDAKYGWW